MAKWKIIVGILSPLLLISIVLAVWFGVQFANTKADYDSMKNDYTSLQSDYSDLQTSYHDLDEGYANYQDHISVVASDIDKYLDIFRLWWCTESELQIDDVAEVFEIMNEAMAAPDDANLLSAYNAMLYCTHDCDAYEYNLYRAIVEGLAEELEGSEGIGCQEWTWIVKSGGTSF